MFELIVIIIAIAAVVGPLFLGIHAGITGGIAYVFRYFLGGHEPPKRKKHDWSGRQLDKYLYAQCVKCQDRFGWKPDDDGIQGHPGLAIKN
jgi:hypothetical protein